MGDLRDGGYDDPYELKSVSPGYNYDESAHRTAQAKDKRMSFVVNCRLDLRGNSGKG